MISLNLRYVCLLCILILYSSIGYTQTEPIIYKLFPSFEDYILSHEGNDRSDICGFALEAKFGDAMYRAKGLGNDSVYILNILHYEDMHTIELLNKTNRYIEIRNNYYPIFIMYYDDIFSNDKGKKNKHYNEKYYYGHLTPKYIYVNIVNKTFCKL